MANAEPATAHSHNAGQARPDHFQARTSMQAKLFHPTNLLWEANYLPNFDNFPRPE